MIISFIGLLVLATILYFGIGLLPFANAQRLAYIVSSLIVLYAVYLLLAAIFHFAL